MLTTRSRSACVALSLLEKELKVVNSGVQLVEHICHFGPAEVALLELVLLNLETMQCSGTAASTQQYTF